MFGHSRKDMGFAKDAEYPLLLIDSNTEEMPACEVTTKDEIIRHMQRIGLIGDYRTHSAFEGIGLKFAEEHLEPAISDLYRNFLPLCQFYSVPKHFKQGKLNRAQPAQALYSYLWKIGKLIRIYFAGRAENSKLKLKEKHINIQTSFDEFCDRMGKQNQFHGGARPDAVDFKIYSIINRVAHTREMQKLLKQREDKQLQIWFNRMQFLCSPRQQF